jgi:hypothetical protein
MTAPTVAVDEASQLAGSLARRGRNPSRVAGNRGCRHSRRPLAQLELACRCWNRAAHIGRFALRPGRRTMNASISEENADG